MKEKIEVLNTIHDIENNSIYLFTENIKEDLEFFVSEYEKEEGSEIIIGYAKPELHKYKFLGNDYDCISFWYDNEDMPNKII